MNRNHSPRHPTVQALALKRCFVVTSVAVSSRFMVYPTAIRHAEKDFFMTMVIIALALLALGLVTALPEKRERVPVRVRKSPGSSRPRN